jgi:GTP cyclohydrolase I
MSVDADAVERAVETLLSAAGIDPRPDMMADTPKRVAATFVELFAGVGLDERTPLGRGDRVPRGVDVVCLRALEFRSMCAHHLLPFSGSVSVAYAPVERLVGIGSIVRTLEILSARPQLQECLAQELADAVRVGAGAAGALVVVDARHSCVADRGPREADSTFVTIAVSGSFLDPARRRDALSALRGLDDDR